MAAGGVVPGTTLSGAAAAAVAGRAVVVGHPLSLAAVLLLRRHASGNGAGRGRPCGWVGGDDRGRNLGGAVRRPDLHPIGQIGRRNHHPPRIPRFAGIRTVPEVNPAVAVLPPVHLRLCGRVPQPPCHHQHRRQIQQKATAGDVVHVRADGVFKRSGPPECSWRQRCCAGYFAVELAWQ